MTALPTELWIIIFDLVIQDGIIRVDDCDHTKFPYIQSILSSANLRYHSYDSYHRLRLVCRGFRAILGDPPSQILSPSSTLPLSATIDAWPWTDFQLLSAERPLCGRLVYFDVTCGIIPSLDLPTLFAFLQACAGRAFPNIQRLTLRMLNNRGSVWEEKSFWVRLHDAFPWLVTLVITQENHRGGDVILAPANGVVLFEWLEILYMGSGISYAGCRFPRLRHASVWSCLSSELRIFTASARLESLLILSADRPIINLDLFSRLKLLRIQDAIWYQMVSPEVEHPLEHLWVFIDNQVGHYRTAMELVKRLPQISRVTIEFSSSINEQGRTRITEDLQKIDFASIEMMIRPGIDSDGLLVIERSAASVGV
jgi:hypothetical protein